MGNNLNPILQSAPTLQGLVGDATDVIGSTNVTAIGNRRYRGKVSATATFLCTQAGTVGTSEIRWSVSGIVTGQNITVIVPASYTLNDPIHVYEGFGVAFLSDTVSLNDIFTVQLTPRRLPDTGHRAVIPAGKVELWPTSMGFEDGDSKLLTWDRRVVRQRRAAMRPIPIDVVVADKVSSRHLDDMGAERMDVTFMEHYDHSTLILFRGQQAAGVPMIGRYKTPTGIAGTPRQDPVTALISATPTGTNLFATTLGPEIESAAEPFPTRLQIPSPYPDIGTGITVSAAGMTQELAHSHPENGNLRWTPASGATAAWDPNVFGVYDPANAAIPEKFKQGTMYVLFSDSTEVIRTAAADYFTVSPGEYVSAQVWIKGRGKIKLEVRTGLTTPDTVLHSTVINLDAGEGRWIGCHTDGDSSDTVPSGDDTGEIRIGVASGEQKCEFWVSHASVQRRVVASIGHVTDGSTANTAGQQLKFDDTPMPAEGTLSVVFKWGGDVGETDYYELMHSDDAGTNFILEYRPSTGVFEWYMDGGIAPVIFTPSAPMGRATWHHIVLRWRTHPTTSDSIQLTMIYDGENLGDATRTSANLGQELGDLVIAPTTVSSGNLKVVNFAVWEVRLDAYGRDDNSIARDYLRWTHDAHAQIVSKTGGRIYNIVGDVSRQIGPGQMQNQHRSLVLQDVGSLNDDGLVIAR